MKIVAVIPSRYQSTRFPGKPLADICGKPMIWWVYNQVKKVKEFDEVYVATDDDRIKEKCEEYKMKVIMTGEHKNHIERVHEVSDKIKADYYFCINGDEPLIDSKEIASVIPKNAKEVEYFQGTYRELSDPVETIDSGNIKVLLNNKGQCIYITRAVAPFPKGTLNFKYNKYVGIECFTKKGLDFFAKTEMGTLEKIEDIDHLRFLENNKPIFFKKVESESLSVDTPKDLEKVISIIKGKKKND